MLLDELNHLETLTLAKIPHNLNEIINHIKSLNPQPHWKPSQQELGAMRTAISVLKEERNFPLAAGHLEDILTRLEGKEVQTGWKPSEEQMKALKYFIKLWGNSDEQLEYTKIFNSVLHLYEELEKL